MNKTSKSILSNFELPKKRKIKHKIPINPRSIGETKGKASNNIGELIRDKTNTRSNEIRIAISLKK
jgi:hypothetical protein